jgi:hypothetical protein
MHMLRRGTSYSAASFMRAILANDDRPRTMHPEAERTDREPPTSDAPPSAAWTAATAAATGHLERRPIEDGRNHEWMPAWRTFRPLAAMLT